MADSGQAAAGTTFHYAVGDVHGCYDELRRLEDVAHAHATAHGAGAFFVCVGDLIDRGPKSREVVDHVRRGVRAGTHACVGGNHEAFLVEILHTEAPWNFPGDLPVRAPLAMYTPGFDMRWEIEGKALGHAVEEFREMCITRWLRCGGRETLESFGCIPDDPGSWTLDKETMAFLVDLPLVWECKGAVVTHALASPGDLALGKSLQARAFAAPKSFHAGLSPKEAKVIEGLLWNREFPDETPDKARIHITGHTPLERPYRDPRTGVVNVDTACVFGNLLTAFCVETGEFLSVPGWKDSPYA